MSSTIFIFNPTSYSIVAQYLLTLRQESWFGKKITYLICDLASVIDYSELQMF